MTDFKTKIVIFAIMFNIYMLVSLFFGQNTIMNYISYNRKYNDLQKRHREILKQRYQLEKIFYLLSNESEDADDVLDELSRQVTQSSRPDEKIIILE